MAKACHPRPAGTRSAKRGNDTRANTRLSADRVSDQVDTTRRRWAMSSSLPTAGAAQANKHRRRSPVTSTEAAAPSRSAAGPSFIERHGLWDDRQRDAAAEVRARVNELGLRQIRVSWGDQHGI